MDENKNFLLFDTYERKDVNLKKFIKNNNRNTLPISY